MKVLVGVSGGVASAVAAALLKNQGYDVQGVHLLLSNDEIPAGEPRFQGRCTLPGRAKRARELCKKMDIPFIEVDVRAEFQAEVEDAFAQQVVQLRAPNVCAKCHVQLKIRLLLKEAEKQGFDRVATGHMVQIIEDPSAGVIELCRAQDLTVDESHLLYQIQQSDLKKLIAPLGGLTWTMIGGLAKQFGVLPGQEDAPTSNPCDNPLGVYRPFIEAKVAPDLRNSGVIRSTDGVVMGEHSGLFKYSIGQPFVVVKKKPEDPDLFVIGYDPVHLNLVVGTESFLFVKSVFVGGLNWVRPRQPFQDVLAKVRLPGATSELQSCRIICYENRAGVVEFEKPQRALCPGHTLVFYEGEEMLGGGVVEKTGPQV